MSRAKTLSFRSNLKLALLAQVVVFAVGVVKSLVLPQVMPVSDYSYWQQYLLYAGFVGIFALGFNDGVFLVYGGYSYEKLPFRKLRTAFAFYCGMLICFAIAIFVCSCFVEDSSIRFLFVFVSVDALVLCVSALFVHILQITSQFKWYGICTVFDKVLFAAFAVGGLLLHQGDFRVYVVVDCASKVVAMVLLVCRCRKAVFGSRATLREGLAEFTYDIRVGVNLMLANFASMLVSNLGRFIVAWFGSLENYAFYSFGLSVTNIVLTFVGAVGTVLYPALKRVSQSELGSYYVRIDSKIFLVACFGLLMYFPVYLLVSSFYVPYIPMLPYLALLFVSAVFQAKMSILVNTCYSALRMEKRLLAVNMQCVLTFAAMGLVSFYLTHDIWWIAASTAASAALRCVMSEVELRRKLGVSTSPLLFVPQLVLTGGFFAVTSLVPVERSWLFFLVITSFALVMQMWLERRRAS